jgi:hypothetical protein
VARTPAGGARSPFFVATGDRDRGEEEAEVEVDGGEELSESRWSGREIWEEEAERVESGVEDMARFVD